MRCSLSGALGLLHHLLHLGQRLSHDGVDQRVLEVPLRERVALVNLHPAFSAYLVRDARADCAVRDEPDAFGALALGHLSMWMFF